MMSAARDADARESWSRAARPISSFTITSCIAAGLQSRLRTDLSDASQTWLNDVARLMNERPRKTLGWKTPAEAMTEEIRAFSSTVALGL